MIVFLARRFDWKLRKGSLGCFFLIGYGLFRTFVENFRQPDYEFTGPGDPLGTVLGPLTMGQVLSIGMIAGGILVLWILFRGRGPEGIAYPIQALDET